MNQPQTHRINYFVNGEEEFTETAEVKVKDILEDAGFTPATDYILAGENPPREYTNPEEVIKVHPNERFQAKFKGPTPTS